MLYSTGWMKKAVDIQLLRKRLRSGMVKNGAFIKGSYKIRCISKKKLHLKFFFVAAAAVTLGLFFFGKLFVKVTMAITGAVGLVAVNAQRFCNIALVYIERCYY